MESLLGVGRGTGWVVASVVPLVVLTAVAVGLAFWREPKIKRRIQERERTGEDERATTATLYLPLSVEVATELARSILSLQRLRYGTAVTLEEDHVLQCRLGPNWQSWGQGVSIKVDPADTGANLIIRSWPITDRALTDWGRGRKVVGALSATLGSKAQRVPQVG